MPQPKPRIDDHVATPETREEYIDGRIVHVAPANLEHAVAHTDLEYVLRASVAPGYTAATDMLTRTSRDWDFAADAAILKEGVDPETGTRYLEELAFEIKNTQRMSDLTRRAEQLIERGVRRVFVICVRLGARPDKVIAGPVFEWSREEQGWIELPEDSAIEDPCLRCPLGVRALIDAAEADDAVSRALLAKGTPTLNAHTERVRNEGKAEGYDLGKAEGLRVAVRALCEVFEIEMTPERHARLDSMDADELDVLCAALQSCRQWP